MPLPPNRMDYSPIIDRPVIKWPNNARVAFWVAPNIEHYEYMPLKDGGRNPWPRTPHPDVQQYSSHEFGNRVGFWRLIEVLDHYDIKCSTTLKIGVLEHFPEVAEAMLKRDWIFVNHGFYNTRYELMLKEGFDTLYRDGAAIGRLLVLNLHPWLAGQPFRVRYLSRALEYMTQHDGVWVANGSEIVDW